MHQRLYKIASKKLLSRVRWIFELYIQNDLTDCYDLFYFLILNFLFGNYKRENKDKDSLIVVNNSSLLICPFRWFFYKINKLSWQTLCGRCFFALWLNHVKIQTSFNAVSDSLQKLMHMKKKNSLYIDTPLKNFDICVFQKKEWGVIKW